VSCSQLLVFSLLGFVVTVRDVQKAVSSSVQEAVKTTVEFLVCDYCSVSPYLPVKMTCFITNTNTGNLFHRIIEWFGLEGSLKIISF